ncbi:MAG: bifunctional riboflavin kinase/FAD synthetase [Spirochaetes bacterium]|nr:bifunctional riboflavin kinase/FAD synthetase [Spirochaetota bacterium]
MIIKNSLVTLNKNERVNLTIGAFDSFHTGHVKILSLLTRTSKKDQASTCIITFKNRPKNLLFRKKDGIILDNSDRIDLFKTNGIDYLYYLNFNRKFADIQAKKFIQMLFKIFNLNRIILGSEFKFGFQNRGNVHTIKKILRSANCRLQIVKEKKYGGKKISTTAIKSAIRSGDLIKAGKLLGRKHFFRGICIKGRGIGKTIDYPTVNIRPENREIILPPAGVYATLVKYTNKVYKSMTYIGWNYFTGKETIEANIFNFNKNIYNKKISVFLIKKLRKEFKFSTLDGLKKQLALDKKKALNSLKKERLEVDLGFKKVII